MKRVVPLALLASALTSCSVEAPKGLVGVYELPDASTATPLFFLTLRIRDFKKYDAKDPTTNPDFENVPAQGLPIPNEKGVVASTLGADDKPVYQTPDNDSPTYGQAYFDQWFRDTPGTNYLVVYPLPISQASDGTYEYDSRNAGQLDTFQGTPRRVFFPIDDGTPYATPFGNQGAPHNQDFTAELHATFTLAAPGATLRVRSDDDSYVFIDKQLVIDNGGTHAALEKDLAVDDLGLTLGEDHALDLFYAERLGATGELAIVTTFELHDLPNSQ